MIENGIFDKDYFNCPGEFEQIVENTILKFFNGYLDQQEVETFLKYTCGANSVCFDQSKHGLPHVYAERWIAHDKDGNDVVEVVCDLTFPRAL